MTRTRLKQVARGERRGASFAAPGRIFFRGSGCWSRCGCGCRGILALTRTHVVLQGPAGLLEQFRVGLRVHLARAGGRVGRRLGCRRCRGRSGSRSRGCRGGSARRRRGALFRRSRRGLPRLGSRRRILRCVLGICCVGLLDGIGLQRIQRMFLRLFLVFFFQAVRGILKNGGHVRENLPVVHLGIALETLALQHVTVFGNHMSKRPESARRNAARSPTES